MRITHFAALVSISVLASTAVAQDQKLTSTDHFCVEMEAYTVSTSNSAVHLSGPCTDVTVSGSNNTVVVDLSSSISVSGSNNQIEWVAALGKIQTPKIQNNGRDNTIAQSGSTDRR